MVTTALTDQPAGYDIFNRRSIAGVHSPAVNAELPWIAVNIAHAGDRRLMGLRPVFGGLLAGFATGLRHAGGRDCRRASGRAVWRVDHHPRFEWESIAFWCL
jgi:hypothetical protein